MQTMQFCDGEWLFGLVKQMTDWRKSDKTLYNSARSIMDGYVIAEFSQLSCDMQCLLATYDSKGLWDIANKSHVRKIGIKPGVVDPDYHIDEQLIKEMYHENRDRVLFDIDVHYLDASIIVPMSDTELIRLTAWGDTISCVGFSDSRRQVRRYWDVYDNIVWQGRSADKALVIETKNSLGAMTLRYERPVKNVLASLEQLQEVPSVEIEPPEVRHDIQDSLRPQYRIHQQ